MEIIDISKDLLKTPVYPGDPEGYVDHIQSLRAGDHCNLNSVYTCLHTATHVDAPLHFIEGGKTIEKFLSNKKFKSVMKKFLFSRIALFAILLIYL